MNIGIIQLASCFFLVLGKTKCQPVVSKSFSDGRVMGNISAGPIDEASGLAASRDHPGVLYTVNDANNLPRLFAISATNATTLATFNIIGAENCDWEDIAIGRSPDGTSYIYIGDVGGNVKKCEVIYKVREPMSIADGSLDIESSVKYSWEEENCETMMVDPQGRVYLVSKVNGTLGARLYMVPDSAWGSTERVHLGSGSPVEIPKKWKGNENFYWMQGPVAGDMSPSGDEVLIKLYGDIFYWKLNQMENLANALQRTPDRLPHISEPQGEAICWDNEAKGYYTLSEGNQQPLYYFQRISQIDTDNGGLTLKGVDETTLLLVCSLLMFVHLNLI